MYQTVAIEILGPEQIQKMRQIGRIAARTLHEAGRQLRAGMTTADIDRFVRADTERQGAAPSQLGYEGFPAAVCTSRNDVACHGVPRARDVLEEGDIIGVDVTSNRDGFHGDTCATFEVGRASPEGRHVIEVARRARDLGIGAVRAGARVGDIGAAIEPFVLREGCSIVTSVGGHGIGRAMHMAPHVPHAANAGRGIRLRAGMALTVEPIINLGRSGLVEDDDGWTLRTVDGRWSAQFEHTILVTDHGCDILTTP